MEILIAFIFALLFSGLIWKQAIFRIKNIKKTWVLALFLVKIGAGLSLTLLYTHYYGEGKLSGDTAHYYHDGQILNRVFSESPSDYFQLLFTQGDQELVESRLQDTEHWTRSGLDQFNDNRFIIRINSLIAFVSLDSFYVHMLFFILFSMAGLVLFFKSIQDFIPRFQKEILLLLFLFPSLLFWSSSVLKESLLILGFGMLIYGVRFFSFKPAGKSLFIFFGLLILINTKVYFLICLIPALVFYLILSSHDWKRNVLFVLTGSVLSLLILWGNSFSQSMNVTSFISQKQKDFKLVGKGGVYFMDESNFYRIPYEKKKEIEHFNSSVKLQSDLVVQVKEFGEEIYSRDSVLKAESIYTFYHEQEPSKSFFEVAEVNNQWGNIIKYSPIYFGNVFFMPFPWQEGSVLKWLNILENLFLYFLIFLSIRFCRKKDKIDQKLFYFSLVFIFIFYVLIGATTPVVGAIVRYRTPAFLIWILLFLSIIDLERITLKSNSKKK